MVMHGSFSELDGLSDVVATRLLCCRSFCEQPERGSLETMK